MNTEITICDIKVPTKREEVCNQDNINQLLANINQLKNNVLNFDTKEQIKESKKFKSDANKFIKEFKEFCDPLEEEGRVIAKTRSQVKLALEKIVDDKLAPIVEREAKLKLIKENLFIPSSDVSSCELKIANLKALDVKALDGYDWFGLREEALLLIAQSITFLENELLGFEKVSREKAEAEEKIRLGKEDFIREQAKFEAERNAQAQIVEANRRAEQAEIEAKRKVEQEARDKANIEARQKAEEEAKTKNKEHQAKIHNEILEDLVNNLHYTREEAKNFIKAIARDSIRNLKIIY